MDAPHCYPAARDYLQSYSYEKNYLSKTRLIQKDEVVPFYDELQASNRITSDDDCHMLIVFLGLQEIISSI